MPDETKASLWVGQPDGYELHPGQEKGLLVIHTEGMLRTNSSINPRYLSVDL